MIKHSKPTISKNDIQSVIITLKSCQLVQGTKVSAFEKTFARFIGVKGALATNSGTSALHLALLAMGIKPGDEIILPSYICTAVLNSVNYVKATPKIIDINKQDFNIDITSVKKSINQKTRAILVAHMFGQPANLAEFLKLGIPIIEDCAQSLGAIYQGRMTGSFGRLAIFSFYATKMMATGHGGMIGSNSAMFLEKTRNLREFDERTDYIPRYNYQMLDIEATLGLTQLAQLRRFIGRRQSIARSYNKYLSADEAGLASCPGIELPFVKPQRDHIFYRYVIKINPASSAGRRRGDNQSIDRIIKKLKGKGVEAKRPVYKPLHQYLNLNPKDFPNTEEVYQRALSLPIYPSLKDNEVKQIVRVVKKVIKK